MEIKSKSHLKLAELPVKLKSRYHSKFEYRKMLAEQHAHLNEFQTLLYAGHRRAMLIIFQGMDTSGKDGAIKHVMSGVNPQGCSVVSFKAPTSNELDHDFLWRSSKVLPARGQIGIFNRSYYEELLVPRVHPELLEKQKLPDRKKHGDKLWKARYLDILNYENYLHRQGYEIVKIFIHISKEEQKRRLMDRFQDKNKQWKISEGDISERSFWKEYQSAYEKCIGHTASKNCPWYVVPGDDKESARLSISQILVNRFEKMKLAYPKLSHEEMINLEKLRSTLSGE